MRFLLSQGHWTVRYWNMSAYVIYQGDVTDETAYEEYKALASKTVEDHGGKYLARGGDWTSLEGEDPATRTVVICFDSVKAAREWYESPEYQKARPLRQAASQGSLYIVEA